MIVVLWEGSELLQLVIESLHFFNEVTEALKDGIADTIANALARRTLKYSAYDHFTNSRSMSQHLAL